MDDCLKEPALFVGHINDEIDLSLPPTSGLDYIKRVVIEAKKCDSVVVAEIDESKLRKPTVNVNSSAARVEAPVSLRRSLQWQQCQIADFSEVRLKIAGLRSQIHSNDPRWKLQPVTLPDMDDRDAWINFLSASSPPEESPTNPPTLGTIFSMSHQTVEQVLEYIVELVETEGEVGANMGRWLYALLGVLELPLNPDICSCLRTLARACTAIRVNADPTNDHCINTLNLFICLVARYFRQLDLAET